MRHRAKRATIGKDPRIMNRTLLFDTVTLTVNATNLIEPTVVASVVGTADVFEKADTERFCAPNSMVKYINLRYQTFIRNVVPEAPGFIEYAVVVNQEETTAPVVTAAMSANIGTKSIGNICRNLFRGKCIWNGAFAVSRELPRVVDIAIKIPNQWCKNKIGQFLTLYTAARTGDVSDDTTDFRTFLDIQYKCYI